MTRHRPQKRKTVTIRLSQPTIDALDAEAAALRPQASRASLIETILEAHTGTGPRQSKPAPPPQRS